MFGRGNSDAGKQVTVDKTFAGTVTIVNHDHDAGCVKPGDGARPICTTLTVLGGGTVQQSAKVHAAHEQVSTGGGDGYDLLLIYPVAAP